METRPVRRRCQIWCDAGYQSEVQARGVTMGAVALFLLLCTSLTAQVSAYRAPLPLEIYKELGNVIGSQLSLPEMPRPRQESHWPRRTLPLGQVAGVAVDLSDRPLALHRGNVSWDRSSFNSTHHYQHAKQGPIRESTLLTLDEVSGAVVKSEGAGRFFMPHGLHVDGEGNRWITDVALHQVFKLPPDSDEPLLVLGQAFQPGHDADHFCQPADVAVADDGTVFVADGYCGRRVAAFDKHGRFLGNFGENEDVAPRVVHSVTTQGDVLCAADREHGRLLCWDVRQPYRRARVTSLTLYGKLFAVCAAGDVLYTVHQSQYGAGALTVDLASGGVLVSWTAAQGLQEPHDIAVSSDGSTIYIGETTPHRLTKFMVQPDFYQRQ